MNILIINCGSSSIKFQLFNFKNGIYITICRGLAERIFIDGNLIVEFNNKKKEVKINFLDHKHAAKIIMEYFQNNKIISNFNEIDAVGHRVVHGGEFFKNSILVTSDIVKKIEACIPLAPLHNPASVIGINVFKKIVPKAKIIATFDTSFHTTIPKINYIYPLPFNWYKTYNVRRYGAHGISYKFIVEKLSKILNIKIANINAIICHLGNGASLCAVENGKSINTSMGLTPLGGIMMGTRSGDLDPSIPQYIANKLDMNINELTDILNKKSGVLGVSEISSDLRIVLKKAAAKNKQAKFSLELYASSVANFIVKYQNDLKNKINAIVFTAGVGENSSPIRKLIISKIKTMNLIIDEIKNNDKYTEYKLISTNESELKVFCIKTNEELMICKDVVSIIERENI